MGIFSNGVIPEVVSDEKRTVPDGVVRSKWRITSLAKPIMIRFSRKLSYSR